MQILPLTKNETTALAVLAVFGFVVPNGLFVYYFVKNPGLLRAAMANPLALTFMLEAVVLLVLFAWLIARMGLRKPSALAFVLMSLAGSLVFSVPATLYLAAKNPRQD
jgi:Na+/melibiose symporter-like transporter